MIILDEDENASASSPTLPKSPTDLNSTPSQAPTQSPPAYADAVGHPSSSTPYPYLLAADAERLRRHPPGENAKRRFLKAFAVALLVWLLFGLFIGSFSLSYRSIPGGIEIEIPRRRKPPLSKPVRSQRCVHGRNLVSLKSTWKSALGLSFPSFGSSTAQFSIPVNADRISFFSNVSQSVGTFRLDVKPARSNYIDVDVELTSFATEALKPRPELAQICLINVNGNWEIVIVSDPLDSLYKSVIGYDITARVPPGIIKALHTNLPLATHKIANLSDKVHFGELEIQTSNALISSGSVSAGRTTIRTSNAPILGDYSFLDSMELVTRNAKLNVDIRSLSNGSVKSDKERTITIQTENARIGANIHLPSSSQNTTQVKPQASVEDSNYLKQASPITIDARTSNADISLVVFSPSTFKNLPRTPSNVPFIPATPLRINARSDNAPVTVTPGDDFVGTFHLETHGAGGCAHVQQPGKSIAGASDSSSLESEDYGDVAMGANARAETGAEARTGDSNGHQKLVHGIHRVIDVWEDTNTASCLSADTSESLRLLHGQTEIEASNRYTPSQAGAGGGALVEGRTWLAGIRNRPGEKVEEGWVKVETVNADVVLKF